MSVNKNVTVPIGSSAISALLERNRGPPGSRTRRGACLPLVSKAPVFSPGGASVDSQGREPLVGRIQIIRALEGRRNPSCGRHAPFEKPNALPGLMQLVLYRPGALAPGYRPTPLRGYKRELSTPIPVSL